MSEDRSLFTFVISLALHAVVAWAVLSHTLHKKPSIKETMEFEVVDKEPRYIVNPQENPPQEKTLKEKLKEEAKFLANLTRRVQEQMRAKSGVRTQNAGQPQKPRPQFNFDPESLTQIAPPPALRKLAIGASEFAESVPGIKQGFFNSLNTDQLTYFTFYNRVNEQIGYRWVSLVKHYLYNLPIDQLNRISESNKRTVVEVLLDQQGNYFSSLIHHSSGIQALDEATYKAFRLATPFINPPQGLVNKEDGLIHLYYEFNVIFDPLPMAGPTDF